MKTKSIPTIKQAVLQEFKLLPDIFRGNELVKLVKIVTRRKWIHTDTPLRKMRELKSEGKLNCRLFAEKAESLYIKQ
jgi:cobalamin biosynthesis Co2+ chelatase CbiK